MAQPSKRRSSSWLAMTMQWSAWYSFLPRLILRAALRDEHFFLFRRQVLVVAQHERLVTCQARAPDVFPVLVQVDDIVQAADHVGERSPRDIDARRGLGFAGRRDAFLQRLLDQRGRAALVRAEVANVLAVEADRSPGGWVRRAGRQSTRHRAAGRARGKAKR